MAGLCGWLGTAEPADARDVLGRMLAALGPPAPDGVPASELALRSGAALAVSHYAGHAGSLFEDDRYTVAWVGRIDWSTGHDRQLAAELGDGTAVARAYQERGASFLEAIRSDVSFAILDRTAREVLLSVDRIGIHSLTYCPAADGLAFASTGTALESHPGVSRDVDLQSIFDYVYFHMIPGPRSAFRDWRKLNPGEWVLLRKDGSEHGSFWTPRYVDAGRATEEDLVQECRETTRAAIRTSLAGCKGKVGAFLSGGIDSSTVAGLLTEITEEPANTYSIGFDVDGFDESQFAHIAARHFGTNHHDYLVTADDVTSAAPRIAAAYAEPFGNASAVASLYCSELAKNDGVTTLFGGDGGDEIFAGNERYAKQKLFEYYNIAPRLVRELVLEPIAEALPDSGLGPVTKAGSYIRQARVPLPDRLQSYNFLHRNPPSDVFTPEFMEQVETDEPLSLMRENYRQAQSESMLHRLLYLDIKFTLADNDLRKVGRTTEMAGIAVRYPFLELELVDFANRVHPELKLKGQTLRYFFKKASEGFLPPEILAKTKHGFGVPCGLWMRDHAPLRKLAHESLASLEARRYLQPAFVKRLKDLHEHEHTGYYGVVVWVLTMLALWHEHHAP